MKVINEEKLKPYLIEFVRVFIILFVIYIINNFTASLPFVSNIAVFNDNVSLSELVSFIIMMVSCFIIYEFGKRAEVIVNDMVILIPQFGAIHSYAVYLIILITAYFAGHNIFSKLIGQDWIWIYNMVFIGFSLFYVSKIILTFYKNSHSISSNIIGILTGDIFKK